MPIVQLNVDLPFPQQSWCWLVLRDETPVSVCWASNIFLPQPRPASSPELPSGWPAPSLRDRGQALPGRYCSGGAAGSCGSRSWCPPGCTHGEEERLDLPAGLWHNSGLCSYLDFSTDGRRSFHWKGLLWKGLQSALAICSGWPSGKCANLHLSMSLHAFGRGKASWLSGVSVSFCDA